MPANKIMVIRHAEKPSDDGSIKGVDAAGKEDKHELIVRGWQRAGALARLFAPLKAFTDPRLAQPKTIFASKVDDQSSSLRPQHTVLGLATLLGPQAQFVLDYGKGKEDKLVEAVIAADGPVLIAWEHEAIPDIGNVILGNKTTVPQKWPGARFDLVWVFDRVGASSAWNFAQVPQLVLSGDSSEVIKPKEPA
jgi:hypothetical protein